MDRAITWSLKSSCLSSISEQTKRLACVVCRVLGRERGVWGEARAEGGWHKYWVGP